MTDTIDNEQTTEEQPQLALVGVDDGPDDAESADEAEPTAEATEQQTDTSGPNSPANVKVGPRMSAADEGHLFELRDRLRDRQDREAEAAELHKAAKKSTEAAQEALNEYIDELQTGQGNLFRGPRPEVGTDAATATGDAPAATEPQAPEAWRDEHITVLADHGVKDRALNALAEKVPPIDTLGQLSDYMAKPYSPLTDIKGIGKVAGENIEAALTAWFLANPEKCPPVKKAQAEPVKAGKLDWRESVVDGMKRHKAIPVLGTEYLIEEANGLYALDDGFSETEFETLAEAKKFAEEVERERQAEAAKLAADDTDGDESDDDA